MLVGKYLNFNMSWLINEGLDVNCSITEIIVCFARGGFNHLLQCISGLHDAHTLATTAGSCFHQTGESQSCGICQQRFGAAGETGRNGKSEGFGGFAGGHFIAHQPDAAWVGTNKNNSGICTSLRKSGIFR